jgi:site-specific DNA recombinase
MQTVRGAPAKPASAEQQATKRAFVYLRVSSEGQVNTDYSRDGLSIDAQREAAEDKARLLGAEIVMEYSDPGRSAFVDLHKRTSFLALLDELERRNASDATRIDYVIVWALSRWARNQQDHWNTRGLVQRAGARLVSITEPMVGEDTPESFYMEGMFAIQNQYESMRTARYVKSGLYQKVKAGGTCGQAPLGYLNVVEVMPDGRRARTIKTDPERSMFITLAFELYASGLYSLSQLAAELERLGLRSRPTPRYGSKELGTSVLQRLLRNRYYVGQIAYKRGTPEEEIFPGRHEPLVDEETFERVQLLLDHKRVAGERPQKHRHYLRGSLFCGQCGRRLLYTITIGRHGGKYPYFVCSGRTNRSDCTQRANIRPELIETAIANFYGGIQLTPKQVEQARQAIQALADVSLGALNHIRVTKTELIRKLTERQDALLDMRLREKSISASVFKRKQAQLESEIAAAKASLAETDQLLTIDQTHLGMALELAGDVQAVYIAADEETRRGYNQAFFKKLLISAEYDEPGQNLSVKVAGAVLTEPYALLLAEGLIEQVTAEAKIFGNDFPFDKGPANRNRASIAGPVSIFEQLVPGGGLEPPCPCGQSILSRPCLTTSTTRAESARA